MPIPGIAHPDHQSSMRRILRLEFSFERDTAFVRKFDGIAEQIQKHLPHPLVIQIQQRKIAE